MSGWTLIALILAIIALAVRVWGGKRMSNRTCVECRYYAKETEHCKLKGIGWKFATDTPCSGFTPRKPIANGDWLRQLNNEELIDQMKKLCKVFMWDKYKALAWLNAPAESEGEDE